MSNQHFTAGDTGIEDTKANIMLKLASASDVVVYRDSDQKFFTLSGHQSEAEAAMRAKSAMQFSLSSTVEYGGWNFNNTDDYLSELAASFAQPSIQRYVPKFVFGLYLAKFPELVIVVHGGFGAWIIGGTDDPSLDWMTEPPAEVPLSPKQRKVRQPFE